MPPTDTDPPPRDRPPAGPGTAWSVVDSNVRGVRRHSIPFVSDPRGNLTVGEFERTLPFRPKRYFIIFDVPSQHLRGEHAHRQCDQFLVCVRGSCSVLVDDGTHREEFVLDRPTIGLHVPPMIWATEFNHSADSTLLVFASDYYDPDDYIRDFQEFVRLVKAGPERDRDTAASPGIPPPLTPGPSHLAPGAGQAEVQGGTWSSSDDPHAGA